MEYRMLGRTRLKISEISFGAWAIGGNMWGPQDDEASLNAIRRALDLGVNFIDSAAVYGNGHSERLIGKIYKERNKSFAIATKVPPKNMKWPAEHGSSAKQVFHPQWIRQSTEKSLRDFNVECIDLQQLHVWAPNWVSENDWFLELRKLKEEGKIRFIGVSLNDHEPDEAVELVKSGMVDSVQVIYNLFAQSPQDKLFPTCQKADVGVLARVPLDEGSLTGKFTKDTKFASSDWRRNYFSPSRMKETLQRVDKLKVFASAEAPSLTIAALNFCLSHPAVSAVIPGIRSVEQADQNCSASDGNLLKPEILELFESHRWIQKYP